MRRGYFITSKQLLCLCSRTSTRNSLLSDGRCTLCCERSPHTHSYRGRGSRPNQSVAGVEKKKRNAAIEKRRVLFCLLELVAKVKLVVAIGKSLVVTSSVLAQLSFLGIEVFGMAKCSYPEGLCCYAANIHV